MAPSRVLLLAGCAVVAGWSALLIWQDPRSPVGAWLWFALVALYTLTWLRMPARIDWRELGLLAALLAVALLPRLLWLDRLPLGLHGDEARHALVAEGILQSGLFDAFADHGWGIPLWGFVWMVPFIAVIGPTIAAVRIASAVAGALTVVLAYLWAKELSGRNVGLIAAGVMLVAHTHLMLSHLGTVNSQALLLTTLVLWLLTLALQRHSLVAAALTASAFAFAFFGWSGSRIVAPAAGAAVLYVLVARRGRAVLRAVAVFVLGTALLAAAPAAYYLRSPAGLDLVLARSDKSILHPAGWAHALSGVSEKTTQAVLERQASGTVLAFVPGATTDTSTFYTFTRPFIDPLTLAAAAAGLVVLAFRAPSRAWAFPIFLIALALISTTLIVDTPNYTRLGIMLTSVVAVAALGIDSVRSGLARTWLRPRAAALLASTAVAAISIVNTVWFFVDYPREGQGNFSIVSVATLAQEYRVPVYVLTADFNYGHEILDVLDRDRYVRPAPEEVPSDAGSAVWVTLGETRTPRLEDLQRQLPASRVRSVTDNAGRIVLQALVPE